MSQTNFLTSKLKHFVSFPQGSLIFLLSFYPAFLLANNQESTWDETIQIESVMLDLSDAQKSQVVQDANPNIPTYHAAKHNELPIGLLSIPLDNGSRFRLIPAWLSILPPLLAILLALWIREVYASLFIGTFLGAFLLTGLDVTALPMAFFRIIDTYLLEAIASGNGEGGVDTSHLSIIVFSLLIGGLVGIISKNGGMMAIVHRIARVAKTAKSALISTWLMGLAIFFDDYSNTLVVGSTMRPLADKLKISRAKLAYVVDSTAAPVAAIGLVTTWIGMQLSEIGKGIEMQDYVTIGASPYSLFLSSLQYALYPVLTLFFVGLVIFTNRGFGPMHKEDALAQTKEYKGSDTADSKDQKASKPYLALIPLHMLVGGVVFGIIYTGSRGDASNLMEIVGASDSYLALLWGSLLSVTTAVVINLFSRIRNLNNTVEDFMGGISSMMTGVLVLVFAWMLAVTIDHLQTAAFLSDLIPASTPVEWMPAVVFILAALVSFSTGSSWSTMAILYPLCIPVVLSLATDGGVNTDPELYMPVLLQIISVVLCASVMGDHCSPISDTTVMSSMATQCDHVTHVRTQLPYALLVGGVSFFCGCVLYAFGSPWYVNFLLGFGLLTGLFYLLSKPNAVQ